MNDSFNPYQTQLKALDKEIVVNQTLLNDPELTDLAKQEIARLETEKVALQKVATDYQASQKNIKSDLSSTSKSKAIIEIRGGAGGYEAKI